MKQLYPHFYKVSLCFLLLFYSGVLYAQKSIVTYFKKNGGRTSSKDAATYTRILSTVRAESGLYELNEYYANGNLKRHGWVKYRDAARLYFDDWVETYYQDGTLQATVRYANNQRIDTASRYYPNGILKERKVYLEKPKGKKSADTDVSELLVYYADSLGNVQVRDGNGEAVMASNRMDAERGRYVDGRREGRWEGSFQKGKYRFEEWYEKGVVTRGVSTDSLGKQFPYKQQQVKPEYPGGMRRLLQVVGDNFRYPKEAIRQHVEGRLLLSFIVDRSGIPTHFKVIDDLGYGMAAAGIAAVREAGKWEPGYDRGVPIRVRYKIPLVLHLNPKRKSKRKSPSSIL